jgi:cytochrome c556
MKRLQKSVLAGIALAVLAGTTLAQMKPEDQIKNRQASYRFMAWNMGKIKANLEGQYNASQVTSAANAIAAVANSGLGALFGPGTETGKGFHKTEVKPAFFKEGDQVKELAMAFNKEANEMQTVAAQGDAAVVKEQFGKLGKTCKACHEKYREED